MCVWKQKIIALEWNEMISSEVIFFITQAVEGQRASYSFRIWDLVLQKGVSHGKLWSQKKTLS